LPAEISARVGFARGIAAGDSSLRLYAILDGETCARRGLDLFAVASAWRDAGVRIVQYRDKLANPDEVLARAVQLRTIFRSGEGRAGEGAAALLILNDHVNLVEESGFDGVHVGQSDAGITEARATVGPDRIVGVSTHSADQAMRAGQSDVDYVAIGPVFGTSTKLDVEPVVGLCGVQAACAVVRKPVVAIGGITLGRALAVRRMGANAVAVISGLLPEENDRAALIVRAQDFLRCLK